MITTYADTSWYADPDKEWGGKTIRRVVEEGRCDGCGDIKPLAELKPFKAEHFCADCRVCCAICNDWMCGQDEVERDGKRVHLSCEVAEVLEQLEETFKR